MGLIDIDGVEDTWSGERPAEPDEEGCRMMYGDVRNASAGLEVSSPLAAEGRTSAGSSKNPNFRSIFEGIAQQQDPDSDGEDTSRPKADSDAEDKSRPKQVLDDHSLLRLALNHRPHMEQPKQRGAKQQSSKAEKKQSSKAEAGVKKKPASNPNTKKDKQKSSPKPTSGRPELVFPDEVAGQRRDEEKMGGWIRHVFVRGKGKQAGENYFEYSSPDGWRYRTRHAAEKNGYSGDI